MWRACLPRSRSIASTVSQRAAIAAQPLEARCFPAPRRPSRVGGMRPDSALPLPFPPRRRCCELAEAAAALARDPTALLDAEVLTPVYSLIK